MCYCLCVRVQERMAVLSELKAQEAFEKFAREHKKRAECLAALELSVGKRVPLDIGVLVASFAVGPRVKPTRRTRPTEWTFLECYAVLGTGCVWCVAPYTGEAWYMALLGLQRRRRVYFRVPPLDLSQAKDFVARVGAVDNWILRMRRLPRQCVADEKEMHVEMLALRRMARAPASCVPDALQRVIVSWTSVVSELWFEERWSMCPSKRARRMCDRCDLTDSFSTFAFCSPAQARRWQ